MRPACATRGSTPARSCAAGRQFRLTDDIHGLFQAESGIAMAARGNAAHQRHGAGARRHPARPHAGARRSGPAMARSRSRPAARRIAAGGWSSRPAPGPTAPSRRSGIELPLAVTQEQVTYFATPHAGGFPAGSLSGLDLDGRSLLLRLPGLRRAGAQGGPGRRREGGHRRHPDLRARPGGARPGRRTSSSDTCPARWGPIIYTKTCLYTLTPDRDFVIDAVPGPSERRSWRSAAATASSSPR